MKDEAEAELLLEQFVELVKQNTSNCLDMVSKVRKLESGWPEKMTKKKMAAAAGVSITYVQQLNFIGLWLERCPNGTDVSGITFQKLLVMARKVPAENVEMWIDIAKEKTYEKFKAMVTQKSLNATLVMNASTHVVRYVRSILATCGATVYTTSGTIKGVSEAMVLMAKKAEAYDKLVAQGKAERLT